MGISLLHYDNVTVGIKLFGCSITISSMIFKIVRRPALHRRGLEVEVPKVYETLVRYAIAELFERVSAGEVLDSNCNLSICINFTVFSFAMAYNNKNVGGLFGCNVTFCVPNQHL